MNTAFIGLGVMGYHMAGHLARQGHTMRVYNRTYAKTEAWTKEFGGAACRTPAEAATGADFVFLCVGNDADVREVVAGARGILAGINKGGVIADHTTTSSTVATEMAQRCVKQGVAFLDAPVSGGEVGAKNGALTCMVGGDKAAFERAEPLLAAYTKRRQWLGQPGAGQLCKMVNQVFLAGIVQGLAEGIRFAQKNGLDVPTVVDTLKHGAAQSWQMENRALTMADGKFDFGFAVDHMLKDLGIVLEQAQRAGAAMPNTTMIKTYYEELSAKGHGRLDTSSLILRL